MNGMDLRMMRLLMSRMYRSIVLLDAGRLAFGLDPPPFFFFFFFLFLEVGSGNMIPNTHTNAPRHTNQRISAITDTQKPWVAYLTSNFDQIWPIVTVVAAFSLPPRMWLTPSAASCTSKS